MSEARYTKGPWVIHESNAIVGEKLDDHPIWLRPVIARFATGVRPADARLMASAPDLLEALQEMWDAHEHNTSGSVSKLVLEAIAKATGGQP